MQSKPNSFRRRVKPEKKSYARSMRKSPTIPEELLWEEIRRKKLGVKFRRQAIILGWIVDFYCPSHNLIVEVDGEYHEKTSQRNLDKKRDAVMSRNSFRILRIKNSEVKTDMPSVLEKIKLALAEYEQKY